MKPSNLDHIVEEVKIDQRESAKTGKPYNKLVIVLTNGYALEYFVDRAELKLLDLLVNTPK